LSVITLLLVVLGIILFFAVLLALLSLVRCRLFLAYKDKPTATLKIGWWKQPLFPWRGVKLPFVGKKKKQSKKQLAKKAKKEAEKKAEKEAKALAAEQTAEEKSSDPREIIAIFKDLAGLFLTGLTGYLRTDIRAIKLEFHGKDAAQTAIIYGGVMQSIAYLMEFFEHRGFSHRRRGTVRIKSRESIQITPVFHSTDEKIGAESEIDIVFTLRLWQIILIGLRTGLRFLKYRNKGGAL